LKNSVESILNPVRKNADKLAWISIYYSAVCAIDANEHTFDPSYYGFTSLILFMFIFSKVFVPQKETSRADTRLLVFGILLSLISSLPFQLKTSKILLNYLRLNIKDLKLV